MKNSSGFITIDYLFAFVLVAGFSLIIITFSATLSTVEVVQYMAFASARNFMAANYDLDAQKTAASDKLANFAKGSVMSPLLSGGWFKADVANAIIDYDIPSKYPAFADYAPDPINANRNTFHGVIIPFTASILAMQIPFFGSTVKSDQGSGAAAFSTNITSFLGREPTFKECDDFNSARWENIKALNGGSYAPTNGSGSYVVINDNGC